MPKPSRHLLSALTLITALLTTSGAWAYTNLFGIGDSLSDTGNLFLATGNPPLSGVFPTALPQQPPYFEGRFADGDVFLEHLYRALGLPGELTPSLIGGTNYAVGGARSRYHAFDNTAGDFNPAVFDPLTDSSAWESPFPFSMRSQVDSLIVNVGGSADPNALYSFWVGSNDVSDAILSALPSLIGGGTTTYAEALLAQSAADIGLAIDNLVSAGARHLLLPTVPDLSLTPQVIATETFLPGAAELARMLSDSFNGLVDAQIAGIDANVIRLDVSSFLHDFVDDPTAFGLPASLNTTEACFDGFVGVPGTVCSDPENFAFFDRIHPSAVTHEVLGEVAFRAVPVPVPVPVPLVLLLTGLAGLALARRLTS